MAPWQSPVSLRGSGPGLSRPRTLRFGPTLKISHQLGDLIGKSISHGAADS